MSNRYWASYFTAEATKARDYAVRSPAGSERRARNEAWAAQCIEWVNEYVNAPELEYRGEPRKPLASWDTLLK